VESEIDMNKPMTGPFETFSRQFPLGRETAADSIEAFRELGRRAGTTAEQAKAAVEKFREKNLEIAVVWAKYKPRMKDWYRICNADADPNAFKRCLSCTASTAVSTQVPRPTNFEEVTNDAE